MSNYHLSITNITRREGRSVTNCANYISGNRMYDICSETIYYNKRHDVLHQGIALPDNAPDEYQDMQCLCSALEKAENRKDSRTGRHFIGSLPNELPLEENIKIVEEYIHTHFVSQGLGVIYAIHEGRNEEDPSKNNPHVHMIVTTRTIGPEGLNKVKDREHNETRYVTLWRESWADLQNQAYERNGLECRVSHENRKVQGITIESRPNLCQMNYQRMKKGLPLYGDHETKLLKEYWERERARQRDRSPERSWERSR